MKFPKWLRNPNTRGAKSQRPKSRPSPMRLEPLEDRIAPAVIRWTNRNDSSGPTDHRFDEVFGSLATQAINVVDAAIVQWSRVIESFNYGNPTTEYLLAFYCAGAPLTSPGTGVGASANVNPTFVNGKPAAATVTINYRSIANSGNTSSGWWIDPTAMDNSEFNGMNDTTHAWFGLPFAPGLVFPDLMSTMVHEVGHAMGLYSNAQMNAFVTDTTEVDTVNTPATTPPSNLWRFDSPNAHALFSAWNSGGGTTTPPSNENGAQHTAPAGVTPIFQAGRTYYGFTDLMNAIGSGSRELITDTHARMLQDAFGYTITLPSRFGTFYDRLDADGTLTITTPGNGPDIVELEVIGTDLYVSMTLGSPVVGPDPTAFTSVFPLGAVNSINIFTGDGGDRVTISPIPTTIPISVNLGIFGGSGLDVLEVNGTSGYDSVTLTSSALTGGIANIMSIINVDSFTLNTGLGHADVDLRTAIKPVTINAFGGDEIIVLRALGSSASATINGNGGNDTITIAPDGGFQDVRSPVTINAGTGNDVINLAPFAFGTANIDAPVVVNGGTENDTLNLTDGNLDALTGLVTFDGGGGLDQVVLNDGDFLGSWTYNVNAASITRNPIFVGLNYTDVDTIVLNCNDGASTVYVGAGVTANLNFNLGEGTDRVFVRPLATGTVTLAGGNPTTLPGDALYLDLAANQSVTGTAANGAVIGPGVMPFTYTGFERRVFLVTNTADSGAGSFRQAILHANAPGPDEIGFNIPGAGVQTIAPLSALPTITTPTIIDGYSQPGTSANTLAVGNDAVLLIELNGIAAASTGLTITAGNSTVRGLVINRFSRGIVLQTGGGNTIAGNFIGTNAAGTTATGFNNVTNGILFNNSPGNTIGGTDPAARNVILGGAGNRAINALDDTAVGQTIQGNYLGSNAAGTAALGSSGINLFGVNNLIGGTATGARNVIATPAGLYAITLDFYVPGSGGNNIVQGNYIGVTADGTAMLGNGPFGIFMATDGNLIGGTTPAARNVIVTASNGTGMQIGYIGSSFGASNNTIQGNYFGLNAAGTTLLPGLLTGIGVNMAAGANNLIGGTVPGAGNAIAGLALGIQIGGGFFPTDNFVQGNFIGTNPAGTAALANINGIRIAGSLGPNNTVGGTAPGAGNVISGNTQSGVTMTVGDVSNTIQGNFIGLAADGTTPLGNGLHGINILGSDGNTAIGGLAVGAGNRIAFNGGDGVFINSGSGTSILGNSIHSNGELGIDLNPNGVTPNDAGDGDTGPNSLQNFPVILTATSGLNTRLIGTLNSTPTTNNLRIEFFASPAADPSGFGEGQRFLGSTVVNTNSSGDAAYDVTLPVMTNTGEWITATATDATGNTSEFCKALLIASAPATVASYSVNDGAAQRSRVTTVAITFDQNIGTPLASAFQLQNQKSMLMPTLGAVVDNSGPTTVVTLTFSGSSVESGSLADGRYTLTIFAGSINGGNFDGDMATPGNNDYVLASTGNPPNNIFRLFGDNDGDGTAAANDFIQFRLALGGNNAMFDFDGDGAVAASDFIQFRLRFGGSI